MSINIRKQHRMAVVSDLLAILSFIVLTLVFKAQPTDFNTAFFIEEVRKIHLTNEDIKTQYDSITDIRAEVNTYIKHNSIFDRYLDEICEKVVGNTMLKLLVANMRGSGKTLMLCDDYDPSYDGSFYRGRESVVSVKLSLYDNQGIGIPGRGYYCVGKESSIRKKGKPVVGSLFHELTHALHDFESSMTPKKLSDKWHNQEERRTISGYIDEKTFDPICDNCFDMYNSMMKSIEFFPRLGHIGFIKRFKETVEQHLLDFYKEQPFSLAWCERYMIQ